MKTNAKKTNSASENAIQTSNIFLEFRKLIHLPCTNFSKERSYIISSMQMSGQNNSDQSYHWTNRPLLLGNETQPILD